MQEWKILCMKYWGDFDFYPLNIKNSSNNYNYLILPLKIIIITQRNTHFIFNLSSPNIIINYY